MPRSNSPSAPEPAVTGKAVRHVVCPACGGASIYAATNPYRPFCGERCKQLDLGAWASERFTLPERESDRSPDFEQS
ncbi:DNA gyrase inhibitor YacG [Hydrogenophaga sp.]|uniref:DNA gyrase inhibitor YacG n=1 Tax=Hydrogenophaga sp. TaxID=1904254 RepID=UPI0035B0933F